MIIGGVFKSSDYDEILYVEASTMKMAEDKARDYIERVWIDRKESAKYFERWKKVAKASKDGVIHHTEIPL